MITFKNGQNTMRVSNEDGKPLSALRSRAFAGLGINEEFTMFVEEDGLTEQVSDEDLDLIPEDGTVFVFQKITAEPEGDGQYSLEILQDDWEHSGYISGFLRQSGKNICQFSRLSHGDDFDILWLDSLRCLSDLRVYLGSLGKVKWEYFLGERIITPEMFFCSLVNKARRANQGS